MAVHRPYVRPMQGWGRRDPFFPRYMAREMTAPFVALYALILLAGIACLALGRDAWDAWIALSASAPAIALHVLLVGIFTYHTFSWFRIMPKTMPPIVVRGRKVAAGAITLAGIAAAALCMAALWLIAGVVA